AQRPRRLPAPESVSLSTTSCTSNSLRGRGMFLLACTVFSRPGSRVVLATCTFFSAPSRASSQPATVVRPLTSAKVSASVKPACASSERSCSVSLLRGNCLATVAVGGRCRGIWS
ncbi:unnamed protein product, partial [Ixodes pacificus]